MDSTNAYWREITATKQKTAEIMKPRSTSQWQWRAYVTYVKQWKPIAQKQRDSSMMVASDS